MKKKYFNKKIQRRAKSNLKKSFTRRRQISKRIGGIINASAIIENRNENSTDRSASKKEVL